MNRILGVLVAICCASCLFAADQRPHVLLIMVDDMGFSDLGYMGGEIDTPNLNALARGGVKFSQFYNSGRCCPTRATLMTGLHPHQTGIGWMTEPPGSDRGVTEPPAYRGNLNDQCVTLAQAVRPHGYATMMAGKWHLGFNDQADWPLQRGFEKYFGCISGATRFFYPDSTRGMTFGNEQIANPKSTTDEAFYTTDAFTDYAIRLLREERTGQQRPTFLYLAYTAPHWPLQAFEDDIAKYRGKYRDVGWDRLREQRFARQKRLGLFSDHTVLSPRTSTIPQWETLDEEKRDEMDLKMAVYAAMVDRVDQNIGRLIEYLQESGQYDNTLILFLSDNGACQEGGMLGRGHFRDVQKRNQQSSNSYGEAWANACNTPFRLYKHYTHEGGTATPFFMHWPAGIEPLEGWYREPAQLIDIMPTILDVAEAAYPKRRGLPQLDGVSLRPAFDNQALNRTQPILIEHETNASLRDGKWKLVGSSVAMFQGTDASRWELYDMTVDRTETIDLAGEMPERVSSMAAHWQDWAKRVKVYPRGENSPPHTDRPVPHPPQVAGRSLTIVANVESAQPDGVVLAHGGVRFGYSLYFDRGRPAFAIRNEGQLTQVVASRSFSGKLSLQVNWTGEKITITVNDEMVASDDSAGLLSEQPALGLYVGLDFRDPVGDYKTPRRFRGKIIDYRINVDSP